MQKLLLLLCLSIFTMGAYSQQFMQLENGSNCDLMVQLYTQDMANGCDYANYYNFVVPAGASIPVTAPGTEEYIYAEVHNWPLCNTGFAEAVGADIACTTCPGWGMPFKVQGNTNGCNSCQAQITCYWESCTNHFHFY